MVDDVQQIHHHIPLACTVDGMPQQQTPLAHAAEGVRPLARTADETQKQLETPLAPAVDGRASVRSPHQVVLAPAADIHKHSFQQSAAAGVKTSAGRSNLTWTATPPSTMTKTNGDDRSVEQCSNNQVNVLSEQQALKYIKWARDLRDQITQDKPADSKDRAVQGKAADKQDRPAATRASDNKDHVAPKCSEGNHSHPSLHCPRIGPTSSAINYQQSSPHTSDKHPQRISGPPLDEDIEGYIPYGASPIRPHQAVPQEVSTAHLGISSHQAVQQEVSTAHLGISPHQAVQQEVSTAHLDISSLQAVQQEVFATHLDTSMSYHLSPTPSLINEFGSFQHAIDELSRPSSRQSVLSDSRLEQWIYQSPSPVTPVQYKQEVTPQATQSFMPIQVHKHTAGHGIQHVAMPNNSGPLRPELQFTPTTSTDQVTCSTSSRSHDDSSFVCPTVDEREQAHGQNIPSQFVIHDSSEHFGKFAPKFFYR
jgi:hypothetical protein